MDTSPIKAIQAPSQKGKTNYPQPFASVVAGRSKKKPGDLFGLSNFGVNLKELDTGSSSSLLHCHSYQDKFVYILKGTAIVVIDNNESTISEGECIGFKAGTGSGHRLINRSNKPVVYLEIGERSPGDKVVYPNNDLRAAFSESGSWEFTHKDGRPY